MILTSLLSGVVKDISCHTGLMQRRIFSRYSYWFSPDQLCFLLNAVTGAARIRGAYVEVGCAWGATTVLLRRHMIEMKIDKVYYAIDTFSGFVDDQVNLEIESRSKPKFLRNLFASNKKKWFDTAIGVSGAEPVVSIEADASRFDFDIVGPIAFALLDIDLYLPTRDVLPKLYERLSPGGIIVVDDCAPNTIWDGALQAYDEFVLSQDLPSDIRLRKLGIIRREPSGTECT